MQDSKIEENLLELREVNALQYLRPQNGCLVDRRTMKSNNFTSATYSLGQTMSHISQSGGDAIWGPGSYLRLKIDNPAGNNATFKAAGVCQLIRNARLTHSSGEVLEYVQNWFLLAVEKVKYHTSADDLAKLKGMIGAEVKQDASTSAVYIIPLSYIFGVFDNQEKYIPPSFLAACKIELDLMSVLGASTEGTAALVITPTIVYDSCQVADGVVKQLLDEQSDVARSGLQFDYKTHFNSSATTSTSAINFDVQQSASLAEHAFAVIRAAENIEKANKDNTQFQPAAASYQFRLGSQYYPQQVVSLADSQKEAYVLALQSVGAIPHQFVGRRNVDANIEFAVLGGGGYTLPTYSATADGVHPIYATSLEMAANGLALSGSSTNNSRLLNFSAGLVAPTTTWTVDVFLCYVRLANIMGNNLVVDR